MSNKNKNIKRKHISSDEESADSDNEKIVANHINKKQKETINNNNKKKNNEPLSTLAISTGGNKNQKLTDILTELSIFEKNKGQIHRYAAYRKSIQSLKAHDKEIKSGAEARKLDGVGEKIAKKIDEIIQTGQLKKLNLQIADKTASAINELASISGIGPKAAQKLFDEGIKSIKDLEKNQDKLNHHQKIGLKYHSEIEQKVPRAEIERFEEIVRKTLLKIDKKIIYQTCGSYRRGAAASGDIDILLSHPDFTTKMKDKRETFGIIEKLVDSLKKQGIIIEEISTGPLKHMGIARIPNIVNNNSNDNNKKEQTDSDSDSDCTTTKEANEDEDNQDATSEGEDFEDDSDATEPEDNSKKVIKKSSSPKKKTITTTTTNNSNNKPPIARRVDFKLIPIESYHFGMLHNTGSDEFNRQMRLLALKKGYTLSEYSINTLIDGEKGEPKPVNSEKEIFDIIGMQYYPPTSRNL